MLTYLEKPLRELSSTKTGSYPHEFLCRTNCSACADYQPCYNTMIHTFCILKKMTFSALAGVECLFFSKFDKRLGAIRAKIGPTSDVDKIFSKMYSQYVFLRNKYS
jgi:hypothetical protein